ncbi:MAG: hypothetical protein EA424_26245 [Planctomycetaceae bacterium]|nr:MAG: hypothetical protein EA424_26245 [Planctomycetaceae bacterium]
MRDAFFLGVILVVPAALVIALLYSLAKFAWAAYQDWRLFRELNVIQAESAARREHKRADRQKRLDNGCEHAFGTGLGGFPPNACPKCGIEREKPMGRCDHVWRRKDGPVIGSYCEKCGKQYQPE